MPSWCAKVKLWDDAVRDSDSQLNRQSLELYNVKNYAQSAHLFPREE